MNLNNLRLLFLCLTFISLQNAAKEYPTVKFVGYIMLDYDRFDANFVDPSNTANSKSDVRRLRLGLLSDLYKDWSAKYVVDVSDDVDVKHAYIKYTAWDMANITIGKQKEGFGLERLMSSKNLLMIERAMVTTIISPGISYGINLTGKRGLVNWQLGYFQKDTSKKGNAVTGRLAWTPWCQDRNLVHIGFGFSQRSLHGETFKVNRKMEVSGADSIIEGDKIEADTVSQTGLEFLWQNKGLVNMAQWQQSTVKATDGNEYQYQGGYYQISYNLSGNNRKYKNAILGGFDNGNDWEATMRISQIELLEENSKAKSFSIGLNYFLKNNLKFMVNVIKARYISSGERLDSGNAISLRAQYHL